MTRFEFRIDDTNNGRSKEVTVDASETIGDAVKKGYDELGETRRPDDHFRDGKGNDLDGKLDKPVTTIEAEPDGKPVIQITGPTGGAYIFLIAEWVGGGAC